MSGGVFERALLAAPASRVREGTHHGGCELAEAQLARIAQPDATIGAWETVDPAHVRREARSSPTSSQWPGPLGGIGIGVKDIIATADLPTTVGLADLRRLPAGRTTPRAWRGCAPRARTCSARRSPRRSRSSIPARRAIRWNRAHTPGGSSSGSAAAVAAGHVIATIGTQTNGSIIRPAAYCGVVGLQADGRHDPDRRRASVQPDVRHRRHVRAAVRDAGLLASVLAERGRIAPRRRAGDASPRFAWLDALSVERARCGVDARRSSAGARPPARRRGDRADRDSRSVAAMRRRCIARSCCAKASTCWASCRSASAHRLTPALNAAIDEGRAIERRATATRCVERERAIAFFTGWLDEYDAVLAPVGAGHRAARPRHAPAIRRAARCGRCWAFPRSAFPRARVDGLPVGLQLAAPAGARRHAARRGRVVRSAAAIRIRRRHRRVL